MIQSAVVSNAEHGASIDLKTQALSVAAPATQFVSHEMWYTVDVPHVYWVEVGVTDGFAAGGGSVNQHVFWADQRKGGGYHEHFPAIAWAFNVSNRAIVTWAGGYSWTVQFAGHVLGTSTNNPYYGASRRLEAGIEASSAGAADVARGYMSNPLRKAGYDAWFHDWGTIKYIQYCPGAEVWAPNWMTVHTTLHGPA